jgi:hypothetical protein
MTSRLPSLCFTCAHSLENELGEQPKCKAFPNGIPDEILDSDFDHRKPYPNAKKPTDNGIRYKKK